MKKISKQNHTSYLEDMRIALFAAIVLISIFIFSGAAFADYPVYISNGDMFGIPSHSVSATPSYYDYRDSECCCKDDTPMSDPDYVRLYLGYSARGFGASLIADWDFGDLFWKNGNSATIGVGVGGAWETWFDITMDISIGFPLSIESNSRIILGASSTIGIMGHELLTLYSGYIYERWIFELGYSLGGSFDTGKDEYKSSLLLRVGFMLLK